MTQLPATIQTEVAPAPALRTPTDADLQAEFLSSLTVETRRAYSRDLADFARFLGASVQGAVSHLWNAGQGPANRAALAYRSALFERRLSPATIARRLSALRSVVSFARLLGRVSWSLEVRRPRVEATRIIHEPGLEGWRAMIAAARRRVDAKGVRDYALIRLLHDLALRRSEIESLDMEYLEDTPPSSAIWILGKGRTERERIALPPSTAVALGAWLAVRGPEPGPLFLRFRGPGAGHRLSDDGIYTVVREIGVAAGLPHRMAPHLLRHRSITRSFELGEELVNVSRRARHKSIQTTMRYVHIANDPTPRIDRLVAED